MNLGGPVNTTTVTAYATPALLASTGGVSVITWSSTNSTSCSSSPPGISGTSGTYTTPNLVATTSYTVTCVGPTGSASQIVTIAVASSSTPVLSAIINAANACAALPTQGTVYYYCDCGTGAAAGCVAGNDANPGTSSSAPRRTIANAITRLNSLSGNNTIALCQGGAFNATGQLTVSNTSCTAGTTCNDIREYSPTTFTSNAKPIVNNASGTVRLFSFAGNIPNNLIGGMRFLNLKLNGDSGAYGNGNEGFFFYNGAHDVTMCNLEMDGFDGAVYNAGGNPAPVVTTTNIVFTGNTVTNSRSQGFLGSGQNAVVSYNYWDGNGSSTNRDHTIYLSAHQPVSNVSVLSNYIHGQNGTTCLGAPVVAHGEFTGLNILSNTVAIDASAASGGCWGISLSNGGYPEAVYFRNVTISSNTLANVGNTSLTVAECPGCVIKNNLIMQDWAYGPGYSVTGIYAGQEAHRTGDDMNNQNQIANNTIWFGPNSNGGATGVIIGTEGSSHISANNTVNYSAISATQGFNCFNYPLTLASYNFINNNHCNSATASFKWEATHGATLAAWETYSSAQGFDTAGISFTGAPNFTNTSTLPYNFQPNTGSILLGKGSAVYAPTSATDIAGTNWLTPPAIGAYE